MLKQDGGSEEVVRLDEGFNFMHAWRGSPPDWAKAKSDNFAMIR